MSYPTFTKGECVRLVSPCKDRRPVMIKSAGPQSSCLAEPREGYFVWNNYDLERYEENAIKQNRSPETFA